MNDYTWLWTAGVIPSWGIAILVVIAVSLSPKERARRARRRLERRLDRRVASFAHDLDVLQDAALRQAGPGIAGIAERESTP